MRRFSTCPPDALDASQIGTGMRRPKAHPPPNRYKVQAGRPPRSATRASYSNVGLGSVGLESRISHLPINLFSLPDRISFGFSATLWYIDTIDASTIEAEDLLLERRRKLRIAVRFN